MTAKLSARELVFGLLVFAWSLRPIWDIDLFMHVAIGRELVAHGLPSTDVLSAATPDAPWIPFQVGYELLVAALDRTLGLYALNALHSALIALAFVLLQRRFGELTRSRAVTVLLLALLFVAFEARIRPRPHVINLLLEALFLLPIASGRAFIGDKRAWLRLFALGVVWSAFHAMGALWLVAVLGAWLVAAQDAAQRRWALIAVLCTLLGIAIVPGSAPGIVHVLRIQDQWKEFVPELAPSWALVQLGPSGTLAFASTLLALACVALAWRNRPDRARYPVLLAALGLAFGAVWIARLAYYAPLAIALVWPELQAQPFARAVTLRRATTAAALAALVLLVEVVPRYALAGVSPWTTTIHPRAFPVAELRALARAGIHGRAYNEAMWGGYALYALYPAVTVISDGRVTFSADVAELLRREATTPPEIIADVAYERFGIDLLIWRHGRMQPNARWQPLIVGDVADVLSRTGPIFDARMRALQQALRK